jgi:hypothetical protein
MPRSYYSMLADDPNAPPTIQTFLAGRTTYPILDTISSIQKAALNRLLSTAVLSRVVNNEYKSGPEVQPLTLEQLFTTVHGAVWSEISTPGKPVKSIPELHRMLQRAHLDAMINMYLTPSGGLPDDARLLAWNDLRTISNRIKSINTSGADTYTRLHLEAATQAITRALEAKQTVGAGGGASRGGSLLDLLGETAAH